MDKEKVKETLEKVADVLEVVANVAVIVGSVVGVCSSIKHLCSHSKTSVGNINLAKNVNNSKNNAHHDVYHYDEYSAFSNASERARMNDHANQFNPNSAAYKARMDNHANQCNPNNFRYQGKR